MDKKNPKKVLPLSPKYNLAGGLLKTRKPKQALIKTISSSGGTDDVERSIKNPAAKIEKELASLSIPSIILTAFMIPKIQKDIIR